MIALVEGDKDDKDNNVCGSCGGWLTTTVLAAVDKESCGGGGGGWTGTAMGMTTRQYNGAEKRDNHNDGESNSETTRMTMTVRQR